MNPFHVFYVGTDNAVVTGLTVGEDGDTAELVTVAARPDVAITQLSQMPVNCVVVECPLGDANVAEFLRRVDEVAPGVARVLRLLDATAPPTTDELWDEVCDAERGTTALATAITEAVDPEPSPSAPDDAGYASFYAARVDADGVVQRVNTSVADTLDRSGASLAGERLSDLVSNKVADRLFDLGQQALSAGTISEEELKVADRHFQAVAVPDGGAFELFLQDITGAKRTERAFHEEQAFLDTVVDNLAELFFVLDDTGDLVRWNDRVPEVSGYSDEDLATMEALEFIADDDSEAAQEAIIETLETGHATVELTVVTADGEELPFEFSGSVIDPDDGGPYICGIGRDISNRLQTERERDAAIEELRRSNAELEQFAYMASHDLREPLRMISSYLQLLERRYQDSLDEDANEFIDYAVDGAVRMREMINQLLVYSRIGRQELDFEPVDCNEVLETVRNDLQVTIEENDASLVVDDLPTVPGDRHQLVQLFENLVGNAIKYSGDAPPRIEVRANREGEAWEFAVEDNGQGIPDDKQSRVFEAFYAGESRDQTGIGLAITKKIVERHGGDVWVESTVGEGSTFYFTLPDTPPERASAGPAGDLPADAP